MLIEYDDIKVVLENLRFHSSKRKRLTSVFKNLHSGERFEKRKTNLRFQAKTDTCGLTGPEWVYVSDRIYQIFQS